MDKVLEHRCNALETRLRDSNDNSYHIHTDELGEKVWFLDIELIADEQCVRDGEAEYIGENLFQYGFAIEFCPFCGKHSEFDKD